MSVFARIFRRATVEQRVAAQRKARSVPVAIPVEELPIAQGLVTLHADLISSLDMAAVDASTGRPVSQQPDLVYEPDPGVDRADTIHQIVQNLMWGGNSIASVSGRGTIAAALHVLNPAMVDYIPDPYDDLNIAGWNVNGTQYPTSRCHLWKMNDDNRRGPLGVSPFQRAEAALNLYGWAYRYLLDYFAAGGNPSLVIRSNRLLAPVAQDDPEQRSEAEVIQDHWIQSRQLFRPAVLDPQWSLEAGPQVQDLEQTVKVLEWCAVETGRLINVPASIANTVAGGTLSYSNTGDELRRWLLLSLGPAYLQRIERGFTRVLGDRRVRIRFDQDSLTRFDVLENAARAADPVPAVPVPRPALVAA